MCVALPLLVIPLTRIHLKKSSHHQIFIAFLHRLLIKIETFPYKEWYEPQMVHLEITNAANPSLLHHKEISLPLHDTTSNYRARSKINVVQEVRYPWKTAKVEVDMQFSRHHSIVMIEFVFLFPMLTPLLWRAPVHSNVLVTVLLNLRNKKCTSGNPIPALKCKVHAYSMSPGSR